MTYSHGLIGFVLVCALAVTGCGPRSAANTSGSGALAPATGGASWADPSQVAIGAIPVSVLNGSGMSFIPPPSDAAPTITQSAAEQIALAPPIPYDAPPKVRHSYLLNEKAESAVAGEAPHLVWVVDISPDQPFPPMGGGAHPVGTEQPSGTVDTSTPAPAHMSHWAWVVVNAYNGKAVLYTA